MVPAQSRDDDLFFDDEEAPLLVFELPGSIGHLVLGSGEWSALALHGDVPDVRVRLYRGPAKIVITGVAVLAGPPGINWRLAATDLREIPLMRLQALLDHPVWSYALDRAMSHAQDVGSDLSPVSGVGPDDVPWGDREVPPPPTEFKIHGAADPAKPPGFYADVASAWSAALASGHKNAAEVLAEANGVEESSVHRWVRVARQKGVLAPSSRSATRRGSP